MIAWLLSDVLSGALDCGVSRHTLRVEQTKSECRQKVEHSCRERAHIARTTENPFAPCTNPMCRHRLSRRPHRQTLFAFILLSSGRCPAPRPSSAVLRQIAMRQKSERDITRADSVPISCIRYAGSLVKVRAPKGSMPAPGAAAGTPVVCYSGAGRRGQTCPDRIRECPVSRIADGKTEIA
jgi:hypothetical protein